MSMHATPSPLAGQTVKLLNGTEYRVEDWWDRVTGGSWQTADWHPAALQYAMRRHLSGGDLVIDDEVLYGKVGSCGALVHVTEVTA